MNHLDIRYGYYQLPNEGGGMHHTIFDFIPKPNTTNPVPASFEKTERAPTGTTRDTQDGTYEEVIIYNRNVIIRTHWVYFSQTKAASGLKGSISCAEILYGGSELCALAR